MSSTRLMQLTSVVVLSTTAVFSQGRSPNGVATQSTTTQVQQNTQAQMQAGAQDQNTAAKAATATTVDAELKGSIDSKKAKTGDPVMAVTRSKAVLNDGTVLPKGTTLAGHVTTAAAYSKGASEGSVSFLFDQAKMKNGNTIPIHAMVRSLKPSAMAMARMNSNADMDNMGSNPAMGASAGGAASSGGLIGNAGRTAGGVAAGAGSLAEHTGQAVGGAMDGVSRTAGNVSAAGTVDSHGAVATAVPGVMLSGATGVSSSATVSTHGSDVHLDSGTQMNLGLMAR